MGIASTLLPTHVGLDQVAKGWMIDSAKTAERAW